VSFLSKEKSLIESRPVELYLFTLKSIFWAQNSGTEDISWNGKIWFPKLITRSTKNLTTNSLKSKLTLETSLSNEFVQQFIFAAPDGIVNFTLYRGQYGDYIPYWKGFVETVTFKSSTVEIICSPMTSYLKRTGLQRIFSRMCAVTVYSTRCGLSEGTYLVVGTIDSISGLIITSTTFGTKANGYFTGGYIETADYSRVIVSHSGNNIILNSPIPSLIIGTAFTAYRGCDHTLDTCIALSNNLNFGGHPWLPHKNPFIGDSIV